MPSVDCWGNSWGLSWNGHWEAITLHTGGGRGAKRRNKYPRRIMVDGEMFTVRSAAEERQILAMHLADVEAQALQLVQDEAPEREIAKARVKVIRAVRRLEETDDREAQWLDRLRREDEEILAVLLH